jgi:ubiquinone/menaquinone biosynthesis C-methylase UbiE
MMKKISKIPKKLIKIMKNLPNRQIIASQDKMLKRFLFDDTYTNAMASHPAHACIKEWLPEGSGKMLLELGCGPGKYVAMLSTLGFQVTGVDPYEFPTWKLLRDKTNAKLISNVAAEQLPFADNSFDCAVCLGALFYFDDPEQALIQLHRAIKPGAKAIITSVNRTNLYTLRTGKNLDPASKNMYTLPELVNVIEKCGFTVSRKFSYGFWPPMLPNLWWYLICVFLPLRLQDLLSSFLKPEHRAINNIFASSTRS